MDNGAIIDSYFKNRINRPSDAIAVTAKELNLHPADVVSIVTSAWGKQALNNIGKANTESVSVASAMVERQVTSSIGYTPLDIIEVGDFFGGYRLRDDSPPDAWNLVKKIVPSKNALLPPAIEFTSINERVVMARQALNIDKEEAASSKPEMFDGKIIERDRSILPAVFDKPTIIRPYDAGLLAAEG